MSLPNLPIGLYTLDRTVIEGRNLATDNNNTLTTNNGVELAWRQDP